MRPHIDPAIHAAAPAIPGLARASSCGDHHSRTGRSGGALIGTLPIDPTRGARPARGTRGTRIARAFGAAVALAAHAAAAQPAPHSAPSLTQIRDDQQLAELLHAIAYDPAIAVDDPAIRPRVQAVMTEGTKQLQARAYDQALANFLDTYARFPSPKVLLAIASILRDMGRLADAANSYQRYLSDPSRGADRVDEVKELLVQLDEQLTLLTVRVAPRDGDVSIDGGPFVAVGSSLVTRVRPGIHLVRIRKDQAVTELSINGFEGESKVIAPPLPVAPPPPGATAPAAEPSRPARPERIDGWLITGTQYRADSATSRERRVRRPGDGGDIAAIVPRDELADRVESSAGGPRDEAIASGALAVLRIDGKGRGFAGGFGVAIARGRFETEIMVLKSDQIGGYVGLRYRLLTGRFRPYAALGVPGFAFDHEEIQPGGSLQSTQRLAIGVRLAIGLEVMITPHLSVQGDLGYEHFFFIDDHFEADVFVPTLGVIGRL